MLSWMLNASEHHFVLAFESVMSKSFCAPLWILVWGLLMCGQKKKETQNYVSGISHTGAFPEVQCSGRERGKWSLQWHFDLDSVSMDKAPDNSLGAVQCIQIS